MKRHLSMAALGLFLAASVSPNTIIRAEAVDRLQELRDRLVELNNGMAGIQAKADAEKRRVTADEAQEIDTLFAEFESIENEIERRTRLDAANTRLAAGTGRQTDPAADPNANPSVTPRDPAPGAARQPVRARAPAQARNPEEAGRFGFRSMGEFAQAIVRANARTGGEVDPRLTAIRNAAPAEYGSEGVGADGGFAVPPDFRTTIMKKVMGEESLLGLTDQQTSSTNTMTFPKDETTPWGTGGIQAYWDGEAAAYTPKKPALGEGSIRLNKVTALVPMTEELLEDAPAMTSYINSKAPEVIDYKVSNAIYRGTGAGMPLGLLNAASLVTQDKESGQVADTILAQNITNMHARMYARWRRNAVWLINQDLEAQLPYLKMPGADGIAVPLYMPPGGLSAAPYGTILGRPVIPSEVCSAVGDVGDIALVDFKQYLTATRVGGIRQQTSIHLWFDYDIMAFKFTLRIAGQPWWASAIARANSAKTLSWGVVLAAR